jgi:1,4-dihydroxy-2-naphthoate octaprenyltransferase
MIEEPRIEPPEIGEREAWVLAARPKTLPAAVAPVAVGIGLAIRDGAFRPTPALAALAVALLLQIGVNLANDYFDWHKGVDGAERMGPTRVTQSGLIAPERVRLGMIITFGAAAIIGAYLAISGGWPVLAAGAAAILTALAYSGGPFPLASHGLGDVAVFIFFGLVAVGGTYYVQARRLTWMTAICATPPGLLITAILVVNNLRDIVTDRAAGKTTLAVLLGETGSRIEYIALLGAAYLIPPIMVLTGAIRVWGLLPLLTLPLAAMLIREIMTISGRTMNRTLAGTARLALVYSLLFAVGNAV